jgi:curved DNA binding protein
MSAAEDAGDSEELDLANSDVCTKYREAGRIASLALKGVKTQIKAGATVIEICKFGDTVITQACAAIYQKKKAGQGVEKGIAFPTCVSLNHVVCHNCPLNSESGAQEPLKDGDLVKIDLGVHVDGFIAVLADTVICGATPTPEAPIAEETGNIFQAAHLMSEVATKLVRPGNSNMAVTEAWEKISETFGVNLVAGTLSHQMKRFVIDGNQVIIGKRDHEMKVDDFNFELNEVYSIDISVSSGDGKPHEAMTRTTIFKRNVDKTYRLKMKASRYLFNEVNGKFPTLPFTLRAFGDEKQARMGVVECQKHDLMMPYPALHEKEGSLVVHFKFTLLLLPSGTVRITEGGIDPALYTSATEPAEETKTILAMSAKSKKKKKKKAKGGGEGGGEAAAAAES